MTRTAGTQARRTGRTRFLLAALPLAVLIGLGVTFYDRLGKDSAVLPSALIGKPVPDFALGAPGGDGPGLSAADLRGGRVSIVNVFASWCAPCRIEHPLLAPLAAQAGVPLFGINYKDKAADALAYLSDSGNPYQAIGADLDGRVGIDWGVYGVPETYVIDRDGRIAFKHVGPLDDRTVATVILPLVARLKGGS